MGGEGPTGKEPTGADGGRGLERGDTPASFSRAAGRDAQPTRGRDRSRSRSRKASRRRDRSRIREGDDDRSRGRSRSRSRSSERRGKRRKSRRRHGRRRRHDSSRSYSDSEETGWERKFLAAAMENAAKARLGVVPSDGSRGGLGMPGVSAAAGTNKSVGRFFDNQGRFINPEGGFNPSGAPRRIPKEHAQWGDWECEACGGHNRKHRAACFTCSVLKPAVPKEAVYTSSVAGRRPRG
jgi:hypothetical protein